MESSQGSFIPQRPTRGKVAAKSFRKVYVLSYVSYLVFFSTLLAVVGIFLYKLSLQSSLNELKQDLVNQQSLFDQASLDRVKDLDRRIDTAKQLVNSHASVHKILVALDRVVADPIQFLSFSYNRTEDPRKPTLTLSAVAREFNEVIFQEQILAANAITQNFSLVGVSLNTQPVDSEQLQLGVQQVVNVSMVGQLSPGEINYTGVNADLPSFDSDQADNQIVPPPEGEGAFESDSFGSETDTDTTESPEVEGDVGDQDVTEESL